MSIKANVIITVPKKGNFVAIEDVEALLETSKNDMKIMINPELT